MSRVEVLLPYQREACALAFRSKCKFLAVEKSRRIGLTWGLAQFAPVHAASGKSDVWYIGYNEKLAREFIDQAAEATRKLQRVLRIAHGADRTIVDDEVVSVEEFAYDDSDDDASKGGRMVEGEASILALRITFKSGRRIGALTSSPRSLRGLGGIVIIDEAAFHDDLDGLLKAATAFQVWGGKVIVVSTHNGVDHPFNQLVEAIRARKKPGNVLRYTLQDAVDQGLCRRVFEITGEEWSPEAEAAWVQDLYDHYGDDADEELRAIPARSGGVYLSPGLVESCMAEAPVVRYSCTNEFGDLPQAERAAEVAEWCEVALGPLLEALRVESESYLGVDFGRVSDLSVFAPLVLTTELIRRIPFLVELRNMPHEQQWQVLKFLGDRLPHMVAAWMDAGGNGSWLAEKARDEWGGGCVEAIQISLKWYSVQLPKLKHGLEQGRLTIPKDRDVRNDMGSFQVIDGIPKLPKVKQKDAQGMKRHGDAGIAIAMAYGASVESEGLDYLRELQPQAVAKRMGLGFPRR